MDALERVLNELSGDFERNNFDAGDNFSLAQDLKKLSPESKRQLATLVANSGNGNGNRSINQQGRMNKHTGGASEAHIYQLIAESVGDLNLTVTRVGTNINAALPFVLFALNDFEVGYIQSLAQMLAVLPAGTTLVVSTTAAGNVVFSYSAAGPVTDTVTISSLGAIPYLFFLKGMNTNSFKTKYFLVSISDATKNLLQFGQPLFFGDISTLGAQKSNMLVFRSRTNSWMYREDRVEVVLPEQNIAPAYGFAMNIIKEEGFSIGFDFFMSERITVGANK